jgi:hypothetical protein
LIAANIMDMVMVTTSTSLLMNDWLQPRGGQHHGHMVTSSTSLWILMNDWFKPTSWTYLWWPPVLVY